MQALHYTWGEGSVTSPYEVDEDESRVSSSSSDRSYPRMSRSPHPYRSTGGQQALHRDGRRMTNRERGTAGRTSGGDGVRPQSPVSPPPPSPLVQPLVEYEGRLVPVEMRRDDVDVERLSQGSVLNPSPNPQFVEGSSRPGIGWRSSIRQGTATEESFEAAARCWEEYQAEDVIASLEYQGLDWN